MDRGVVAGVPNHLSAPAPATGSGCPEAGLVQYSDSNLCAGRWAVAAGNTVSEWKLLAEVEVYR